MKEVKVIFRQKRGARSATQKVVTTVRAPRYSHPKQIHLGYIPSADTIRESDKRKLDAALRKHWTAIFGSDAVRIDWADADKKWPLRDAVKQHSVDRNSARKQLHLWLSQKDDVVIQEYGGHTNPNAEIPVEHLVEVVVLDLMDPRFERLLRAHHLEGDLATRFQSWWMDEEVPRLLHCCHRFASNHAAFGPFRRDGFYYYLLGNLRRGYAFKAFFRHFNTRNSAVASDAMCEQSAEQPED